MPHLSILFYYLFYPYHLHSSFYIGIRNIVHIVTLREILRRFESTDVLKDVENAQAVWLRIKNAFNEEASSYDEKAFDSVLQSTGSVSRKEGFF